MASVNSQGRADLFLKITTKRGGLIKGEAVDEGNAGKHTDEIEVLSWSWGIKAPTDAASGAASGKRQYRTVRIVKQLDSASPALMAALSNNDAVKEAVLVARKAGGVSPIEFFTLKISNGRLVQYDIDYPDESMQGRETLEFAFQKIDVTYLPQGKDGAKRGAIDFSDEWAKEN